MSIALLSASWSAAGPGQPASVPTPAQTKEDVSADVIPVNWSDIVRLVNKHPRIAAGQFQVNAARSGVEVAGAVPNPTLEGTVGQGRARTGETSRIEWGLALNMPLGWIAQRDAKIDVAEAEVDVATAEVMVLRREVLQQLGTLFWNLAYEQARVRLLLTLEAQGAELVRIVTKRVDKGEARPLEATRVEIELEKVRGELDAASTSLSARQEQLSRWLGVPQGMRIEVTANLETLPVPMDRENAITNATSFYPTLVAHRARMRSLSSAVRNERMARVPSVVLSGFTTYELDRRGYGVGLGVDVPIWNWNSGRIAQSEARLSAERNQLEATFLDLTSNVIEAQATCSSSVVTSTRLRDNVVPRSVATASTMEKMYQLGETSLLEVIDARRTLLDSYRLYLSAIAQAQIECSHLGVLVGVELP